MYEDKTLVCRDCGAEFVFTAGEQAFYAEKGFQNEPTRCKSVPPGPQGKPRDRPMAKPREMYETALRRVRHAPPACPSSPKSDRPIYCSECFAARRNQD